MNEEQIRDEARKAANRSQFMSNHIYDHKSYEDGFYEGMNQALRQPAVMPSLPNETDLKQIESAQGIFRTSKNDGNYCP